MRMAKSPRGWLRECRSFSAASAGAARTRRSVATGRLAFEIWCRCARRAIPKSESGTVISRVSPSWSNVRFSACWRSLGRVLRYRGRPQPPDNRRCLISMARFRSAVLDNAGSHLKPLARRAQMAALDLAADAADNAVSHDWLRRSCAATASRNAPR